MIEYGCDFRTTAIFFLTDDTANKKNYVSLSSDSK